MEFEFMGRKFDLFTEARQYTKFLDYLHEYVLKPSMFFMLAFTVIYLLLIRYFKRNGRTFLSDKIHLGIPLVSMAWLVSFYLLDREPTGRNVRFQLDNWLHGADKLHESAILTFVLNILIFVIFGYIVNYFWKGRIRNICLVAIFGLLIEEAQYLMAIGDATASDFFAYAIGGIIGGLVCRRHFEPEEDEDEEP